MRGVVEADDTGIDALVATGLVVTGPRGVRVTSEGRIAHAEWARAHPGSAVEATLRRTYARFLPLNQELLRICNDWQVRAGGTPNDHRDARYDWSVIDRLRALDERAGPVIGTAARSEPRFAGYRPLLRAAFRRVHEGAHEWVTSPRCDSYHTVWMRLHEDLLLALGIDRADEAAG